MCEMTKDNRLIRTQRLLSKFKYQEAGIFCFLSDENNFDQDQEVKRNNDTWSCQDPKVVPTVMYIKFPATFIVLGITSNEGYAMTLHVFPQGLRTNADDYIDYIDF